MQGSKGIWKGLVVLFSVSLAACFVAYRAGAFDGLPPLAKPIAAPSTVDEMPLHGADASMMPSSKSGEFLSPEEITATQQSAASVWGDADAKVASDSPRKQLPPEDKRFMSSSKDAMIFEPSDSEDSDGDEFMGSSKSDKIFRPARQQDNPKTNDQNPAANPAPNGNAPNQQRKDTAVVVPTPNGSFMGSSKSAPVFGPTPKMVFPSTPKSNNPPK